MIKLIMALITKTREEEGEGSAHNGEEDDEDGDDCNDARVLARLGILKQEPDAPKESKLNIERESDCGRTRILLKK